MSNGNGKECGGPADPRLPCRGTDLTILLVSDDENAGPNLFQSLLRTPAVHRIVRVRKQDEALQLLESGFWPDLMLLLFQNNLQGFEFIRQSGYRVRFPTRSVLFLKSRSKFAKHQWFKSGLVLVARSPSDLRSCEATLSAMIGDYQNEAA